MEKSKSKPSLQTLPWLVRYRIYELLGAVQSEPFELTALTSETRGSTEQFHVELMRVCRSFYDDLNSVLYSSNAFLLRLSKAGAERRFLALSPSSLSLMKTLAIQFGSLSGSPSLEEESRELLNQFRTVLQHLAKSTDLSELTLTVYGMNISNRALDDIYPVFSGISSLRACNIRLSESVLGLEVPRNEIRYDIARRIAVGATGPLDNSSFPFGHLPVELQRRVLSYTGLALPFRRIGLPQGLEIISEKPQYQQDDNTDCCGKCTGERKWPVCCCITVGGDAFSKSCICYHFPVELFTVNRHVSQLAREVAFSENRIIMRDDYRVVLDWLREIPHNLLTQIRALDLIVENAQLLDWGNFKSRKPGMKSMVQVPPEWAAIAQTLDERHPLKNLTLSIDAAHWYDDFLEDELIHGDAGKEHYEWLKDLYRALAAPFASRPRFRELRNFFVYGPIFGSTEDEVEKAVMGPGYDAQVRGKMPYQDRDWRLPHGWEWGEEDANGELNQDWLDYSAEYMQDIE